MKRMKRIRWRLGAGIAAAALLGLAFGAVKTRGLEGGVEEATRYEAKQGRLLAAIAYGQVGQASFSEREINAYLDRLLEDNGQAQEARGLQVGVEELHCDVAQRQASLFVSGRLVGVPLLLEYRVKGLEEDGIQFGSVRLGRLPLVPPLKWIALGHLKHLLGGVHSERKILQHLEALEIEDDEILVTVAG